jgi:hypothetical protein
MDANLQKLIDRALTVPFTSEMREAQRRSFAYGNTHFENPLITREMIDQEAAFLERLKTGDAQTVNEAPTGE